MIPLPFDFVMKNSSINHTNNAASDERGCFGWVEEEVSCQALLKRNSLGNLVFMMLFKKKAGEESELKMRVTW